MTLDKLIDKLFALAVLRPHKRFASTGSHNSDHQRFRLEITLALFKPRAKQFSPEGERVTLVLWSIVQIRKSAKQKLPLDFPCFYGLI
ncbi:unnamed protein product [Heterobilharzia americana]|nr:unnamed protein product [Heterobilharzia americana]